MAGPSTTAVHGVAEPHNGAVGTPIYQSSTFLYPELADGSKAPYIYSRYENPTNEAVEGTLAKLEGAKHALLYASGLAAVQGILQVKKGEGIAIQRGIYGGTVALLQEEYRGLGVPIHVLDEVTPPTSLPTGTVWVWMESITNPLLRVADIAAWAKAAHAAGARLVVDATFATPLGQRPLELGADVVMHSATKALGGHSDLLAGVAITNDDDLRQSLWRRRRNLGATLDPHTAWLLGRGLKTIALRVQRQCENAMAVALFAQNLGITVHYPGLPSHPDHKSSKAILQTFGGVVTLDVGSLAAAQAFRRAVKIIVPAASLGGVESLVSLPAETSHAYLDEGARKAMGISDGLLRLSCGIEDTEDLVADLKQALSNL